MAQKQVTEGVERHHSGLTSCDIGVVIATFNRRVDALDAVSSVVNQTLPARQVVVVDDGSTDGTAEAVSHRFPGVLVLQQQNLGQAAARNAGIAALDTEWVAFLDDDDLWHPRKLELTQAFLTANPACSAVRTPVWVFSDGAPGTGSSPFGFHRDFTAETLDDLIAQADASPGAGNDYEYLRIAGASFERMLEVNRGVTSSTVIKRGLAIKAGGFPVQCRGSDDWFFFLNVARFAEWELMEDRLSFVRVHPAQATQTAPGIALGNLGAKVAALYGGRPISDQAHLYDPTALAVRYAPWYRTEVNGSLWSALERQQWHDALVLRRLMPLLLPRFRDRLSCYLPPKLYRVLTRIAAHARLAE